MRDSPNVASREGARGRPDGEFHGLASVDGPPERSDVPPRAGAGSPSRGATEHRSGTRFLGSAAAGSDGGTRSGSGRAAYLADGRRARRTGPDGPTGETASLALGLALLALAGWIDAVGLVRWHGLYVSFMSGNTTEFGGSLATADWPGAWEAGRALLMFVVGVVAGEVFSPAAGRWRSPVVLTVEAALLWLAVACVHQGWGETATVAIAGFAMGVQTAALHKANGVSVPLTYVSGTLVNFGRAIAAALRGDASWRKALPFARFWLSLFGGAVAGSAAARAGLEVAMTAAAGIASALAMFAGAAARRRAEE